MNAVISVFPSIINYAKIIYSRIENSNYELLDINNFLTDLDEHFKDINEDIQFFERFNLRNQISDDDMNKFDFRNYGYEYKKSFYDVIYFNFIVNNNYFNYFNKKIINYYNLAIEEFKSLHELYN